MPAQRKSARKPPKRAKIAKSAKNDAKMAQKPKPGTQSAIVAENREFRAKMKARRRIMDPDGRLMPYEPHKDVPMVEFWQNVDKGKMKDALLDSGEPAAQALVNDMVSGCSMSAACRRNGISLQKLNELYQKHNLALGMIGASDRLPKVLIDTAWDAESQYILCERCDGAGEIQRTRIVEDKPHTVVETCPKCKGEREVRVPGDPTARTKIFEMYGLTGRQQGPLVALQQNFGNLGDTLEDTLSVAQKLLIKPRTKED